MLYYISVLYFYLYILFYYIYIYFYAVLYKIISSAHVFSGIASFFCRLTTKNLNTLVINLERLLLLIWSIDKFNF